jgi:ubiquitin carboxyl-terminal hydrolase 10
VFQVVYPTLGAFIDFISNFDMPEDRRTKLNGKGGIECGKSLSPVMFDPVLRIFNPNLPTGVSAHPRFDLVIKVGPECQISVY